MMGTDEPPAVLVFDSKPYSRQAFESHNNGRCRLRFVEAKLNRDTVGLAAGQDVVCVFVNDTVDAGVVAELARLGVELLALRCAGHNNVDLAACRAHHLSVVHVPAYSPHAVAEHAVALMLCLNRRLHRAHNRVREGDFSLDGLVGFDMFGKTVGVVGTGRIGKCLVHIVRGFGCRVLAHDAYPSDEVAALDGVAYVDFATLAAQSDIISLHAPLAPATRHLIDEAAIARMKDGVMLINTSRGALVDTEAVIRGLLSGRIGAAGLDVYEEEAGYFFEDLSDSVIADDVLARLMTFNNVLVTSHMAFLTREALGNIADTTLANIAEFAAGKREAQLSNAVGD